MQSVLRKQSASLGHKGYTGQDYDPETGLVYLRARYYDPRLGRFISVDPFSGYLDQPESQNRHVYVENNPIKLIDPLGLDTWSLDFSLTAGAWGYGLAIGYAYQTDSYGGSALQFNLGGGKFSGNWGVSLTNDVITTNASTVDQLTGTGGQVLADTGKGIFSVEAGKVFGNGYTGTAYGGGLGIGFPAVTGNAFVMNTWNIPFTYDPGNAPLESTTTSNNKNQGGVCRP